MIEYTWWGSLAVPEPGQYGGEIVLPACPGTVESALLLIEVRPVGRNMGYVWLDNESAESVQGSFGASCTLSINGFSDFLPDFLLFDYYTDHIPCVLGPDNDAAPDFTGSDSYEGYSYAFGDMQGLWCDDAWLSRYMAGQDVILPFAATLSHELNSFDGRPFGGFAAEYDLPTYAIQASIQYTYTDVADTGTPFVLLLCSLFGLRFVRSHQRLL